MATILAIWLFVKLWKKTISISDKLPTRVWDTLVVVSFSLFALSITALLVSPPSWCPPRAINEKTIAGIFTGNVRLSRDYSIPSSVSNKDVPISVGSYDWSSLPEISVELLSISACETAVHLESSDSSDSSLFIPCHEGIPSEYPLIHISSHFSLSSLSDWTAIGIIAHEIGVPNNPTQTIAPASPPINKQEPVRDVLFWILVFNAAATGFNMVSTIILAWISHRRLQAELLLKKYEAELKLKELMLRSKKFAL